MSMEMCAINSSPSPAAGCSADEDEDDDSFQNDDEDVAFQRRKDVAPQQQQPLPPSNRQTHQTIVIAAVAFLIGAACGAFGRGAGGGHNSSSTGNSLGVANANTTAATMASSPSSSACIEAIDDAYLESSQTKALVASLIQKMTSGDDNGGGGGGPLSVLTRTSELMNDDNAFLDNCHHITHRLGRAAYRSMGVEGALADFWGSTRSANLLRICNGAFLHGIIETHLKEVEDPAAAAMELDSAVCSKLRGVPEGTWECRHGIGHGFVQNIRDKNDRQTIDDAIAMCQQKPFAVGMQQACENGVWMDYFVSSRFEGAFSFDAESAISSLTLCAKSATTIANDCALYSPTEYLLHRPRDYKGALRWCLEGDASTLNRGASLKIMCVGGVGMQTAKENLRDYSKLEEVCLTAPTSAYQKKCASMGFVYRSFSSGESHMPLETCHQMNHFQKDCLQFSHSIHV